MFMSVLTIKKYLYAYAQINSALKAFDFHLEFLQRTRIVALRMTFLEVVVTLLSVYMVYVYIQTKFWVANNMIAICFTVSCIENWLVGNIKHIALIFVGLIAYDVYFVFASDVMMTVATQVDLPLKLLFPVGSGKFTMIGLGDIIIPGLLASLSIRADLIHAFKIGKDKAQKDGVKDDVSTYIEKEMGCYYFNMSLIGFLLGLACTYSALVI